MPGVLTRVWSSEVHLTAPSSQMYVWMDVAEVVLVVSDKLAVDQIGIGAKP